MIFTFILHMNKLRLRINGPKEQSLTLVDPMVWDPRSTTALSCKTGGDPLPCGGGIFELPINIHLRAAEGVPPDAALFLWNPVVSRGDNLVAMRGRLVTSGSWFPRGVATILFSAS